LGSVHFLLFRRGAPLDAGWDYPFSNGVDDVVRKLICDVPQEGVPPFLAETAVLISKFAEDACPARGVRWDAHILAV
jgi:hypothetical protein